MKITLPWPPAKLNPNRHGDRRAISGMRKHYRDECFYLTREQMAGQVEPARDGFLPLRVTMHQPDGRHRDVDNMLASVKNALDGMAMALRINDRQFKPVTIDWERGGKLGSVVVEVGP